MKYKLGVIGLGVMGEAILTRFIEREKFDAKDVCVFDIDSEKIDKYKYGVVPAESVAELVDRSERILFAVKPQHYKAICDGIDFNALTTIYSIMAGVSTSELRSLIGSDDVGIVRIMPNVPCKIGKGVCGMTFDNVSENEQEFAKSVFSACGAVVVTDETKFDAITSVSGSGPAYVYMFAQGMIQGGMNGGLTYEESKILALDTLIGAAEIAKSTDTPLDVLVDRVCSKGGTTIEAVKVYKENNLTDIIAEGVDACRKKSEILSRTI
jgi:pyrroline-5-carboxylate reductase